MTSPEKEVLSGHTRVPGIYGEEEVIREKPEKEWKQASIWRYPGFGMRMRVYVTAEVPK